MWDLVCCFVSVATVSKCLGLDFPPAAVKGLQAGLLPVQTHVPGEMLPGKPSIQSHWDAVPGAVPTCSPQWRCLYCEMWHHCAGVTSLLAVLDVASG